MRVRNSVKTGNFRFKNWKWDRVYYYAMRQYDFPIFSGILTFSTPISQFCFIPSSSINWLIGLWTKISSNLSNVCSEMFISENGTEFWEYNFSKSCHLPFSIIVEGSTKFIEIWTNKNRLNLKVLLIINTHDRQIKHTYSLINIRLLQLNRL